MPKKLSFSSKRKSGTDETFKTVDEAFLRFFPFTAADRGKWENQESGAELAERLFAKAIRMGKA